MSQSAYYFLPTDTQRKTLYNRYLHWSTQQKDGFFDHLVPVNIADFDNATNLFYRDVRKD